MRSAAGVLLVLVAASCSPQASRPPAPSAGPEEEILEVDLPAPRRAGDGPADAPAVAPEEPSIPGDATNAEDPWLGWLARHQSSDGSWNPDPANHPCGCLGGDGPTTLGKVGTTGLVLLAFLAHGETHKTPRYGTFVRGGLKFLRSVQREDGMFSPPEGPRWALDHAFAAVAACEAFGRTQSPLFKPMAERGASCAQRLHEPGAGWGASGPESVSDLETTAWMTMTLRAGAQAGLTVDPGLFREVRAWVDREEPWQTRRWATPPSSATEQDALRVALAAATRRWCAPGERDETTLARAEFLAARPPLRGVDSGPVDSRLLYFGTLLLHGEDDSLWGPWMRACEDLHRRAGAAMDGRCGSSSLPPTRTDESRMEASALAASADASKYYYRRLGPRRR